MQARPTRERREAASEPGAAVERRGAGRIARDGYRAHFAAGTTFRMAAAAGKLLVAAQSRLPEEASRGLRVIQLEMPPAEYTPDVRLQVGRQLHLGPRRPGRVGATRGRATADRPASRGPRCTPSAGRPTTAARTRSAPPRVCRRRRHRARVAPAPARERRGRCPPAGGRARPGRRGRRPPPLPGPARGTTRADGGRTCTPATRPTVPRTTPRSAARRRSAGRSARCR